MQKQFSKLTIHNQDFEFADISSIANIEQIPFSYRILIENILRQKINGDDIDADKQIDDILNYKLGAAISFMPNRILSHDILGKVMLVDFLAYREALQKKGIDPKDIQPKVIVIDSIQTMVTDISTSAPGSVTQVRDCAAQLTQYAKQTNTVLLLIGHVTKGGALAGPRILEHMVDAVLYFEGDPGGRYRIIRAVKNRFGSVNEISVFAMGEKGLQQISNPSSIFLSNQENPSSGSMVMVTREATRPLLVEIQALVDQANGSPKRVSVGLDQNRLSLQLAILHKHSGISTFDQDVFINVVGGIKVSETASDLVVMLAIVSSLRDKVIPNNWIAFGEVGLTGEVRPVYNAMERLSEAQKQGFELAIIPQGNAPKKSIKGLKIVTVGYLYQAIQYLLENS